MDDSTLLTLPAALESLRSWTLFVVAGMVPIMVLAARDAAAFLRARRLEATR
jgi:hypothetical protein